MLVALAHAFVLSPTTSPGGLSDALIDNWNAEDAGECSDKEEGSEDLEIMGLAPSDGIVHGESDEVVRSLGASPKVGGGSGNAESESELAEHGAGGVDAQTEVEEEPTARFARLVHLVDWKEPPEALKMRTTYVKCNMNIPCVQMRHSPIVYVCCAFIPDLD